jgi:hypothetical protein
MTVSYSSIIAQIPYYLKTLLENIRPGSTATAAFTPLPSRKVPTPGGKILPTDEPRHEDYH